MSGRGLAVWPALLLLAAAGTAEARIVLVQTPRGPVWTNVPEPAANVDVKPSRRAERWRPQIRAAAARHGVPPELVEAVMACESNFDPEAVSRVGASGLMQLMPATARIYGLQDPFDPRGNIEAGVRHLASLLESFEGDERLVIAAYNAGEGAVRRNGGIPPYAETVRYVGKVLGYLSALRGEKAPAAAPAAAVSRAKASPSPQGQSIRLGRDAQGRLVMTNSSSRSQGPSR